MAETVTGDFPGGGVGATVGAMIKSLFPQKRIDRQWKNRYPFMSELRKSDRFEGDVLYIPIEYDHPSVSSNYSKAKANKSVTKSIRWAMTRKQLYGFGCIDAETMAATRSNKGGFVRLLEREISNVQLSMQKRVAVNLFRDSGGSIGQQDGNAPTDDGGNLFTVTLAVPTDVSNFNEGQTVVMAAASDGATLRTGTATVTSIDLSAGSIQLDDAASGLKAAVAAVTDDYIFPEGDAEGQAANRGMMAGLADWIPLTAPAPSDDHFGVDRSVNPERLAGHRLNDATMTIEESIQKLVADIAYTGGMPGSSWRCFMSPRGIRKLALELDAKVERDPGGTGVAGFSGFRIETALGSIVCVGDPACPDNRGYVLDMSTWELLHLKPVPHLIGEDGLRMLRVDDADEFEFGYRLWANLTCHRPGSNGVFAVY